eukprot:3930122-Prymnesium_polylepis.1
MITAPGERFLYSNVRFFSLCARGERKLCSSPGLLGVLRSLASPVDDRCPRDDSACCPRNDSCKLITELRRGEIHAIGCPCDISAIFSHNVCACASTCAEHVFVKSREADKSCVRSVAPARHARTRSTRPRVPSGAT